MLLRILARPALQCNAKAYFSQKKHIDVALLKKIGLTHSIIRALPRVLETKFVPLEFYKRKPEVFNILRQILRLRLYHRRKSCKKTLPLRLRISISLHLRWMCEHHLQLHLRVNLLLTCEPGYMIYLVTLFVRIIIIIIVIIISL